MRFLIFAAFAAFMFAGTGIESAEAGTNCRGLSQTACEAAQRAAARAPYRGPLKPTTQPMACLRAVGYGHTEIVWVAGNKHNYTNAPVIEWQGAGSGYSEPFALNGRLTVVESCIPRSKIAHVRELVICTGTTPGQGFHWELSASELASLKRTGHFASYVPLMRWSDINAYPVAKVRATYRVRYGR